MIGFHHTWLIVMSLASLIHVLACTDDAISHILHIGLCCHTYTLILSWAIFMYLLLLIT